MSKKNVTNLIQYMEFKAIIDKEIEAQKTNEELNEYITNNPLLQNLFSQNMLSKENYMFDDGNKADVKLKSLMQKFYCLNNGLDDLREF